MTLLERSQEETYIFFTSWCKFLLGKLQGFFYSAITNKLYHPLLLKMKKQFRICIQYLHMVSAHLIHIPQPTKKQPELIEVRNICLIIQMTVTVNSIIREGTKLIQPQAQSKQLHNLGGSIKNSIQKTHTNGEINMHYYQLHPIHYKNIRLAHNH